MIVFFELLLLLPRQEEKTTRVLLLKRFQVKIVIVDGETGNEDMRFCDCIQIFSL